MKDLPHLRRKNGFGLLRNKKTTSQKCFGGAGKNGFSDFLFPQKHCRVVSLAFWFTVGSREIGSFLPGR